MTTATERESTTEINGSDELDHISTWGNPDRSLCGRDISGMEWADASYVPADPCVVCFHMDGLL